MSHWPWTLFVAGALASCRAGHPTAVDATATVELDPEEQRWLAEHQPLIFTTEPSYGNVEWFDEAGRHRGLAADYFELIRQRLQARIDVVRAPDWEEALRRAEAHEVAGLTAAQPTPERLQYLDFTEPIAEIPFVVVVRANHQGELPLEALAARRVSVTNGNAMHEHLRTHFPKMTVVPYPDDFSTLLAVSFDQVDAAVVNLAVASWLVERRGISNLRVAVVTKLTNTLAIATRNDQPLLRSIMAKGLAAVSVAEREAIRARWLRIDQDPFVSRRTLGRWGAAVLAVLALLGFLVLLWTRTLKREVRRATAALRRTEGKLSSHLEQTAMGVIEFDLDFRIAYWSPGAERIFGWRQDEVVGQEATVLVPLEAQAPVRQIWQELLTLKGGRHHIHANVDRAGRPLQCEWFNTPLANDAGQLAGVMSLVVDVSERERRTEAQARAQRLESLALLAGGIAHDFNNLVTGILANISLLRTSAELPTEQQEILAEAETAALRTKSLARQLLTFSRGGAPVRELFDAGPVVQEAARFAARGVAGVCRVEVPAELWTVYADADQLGQVVQNLVLNAFEARADGQVTIVLTNITCEPPHSAPGPYLRIRVVDQGPGIATEHLAHIFDPFFSTKERGSGLGLAVTHSIVARHGGMMEVRSELGCGTTFDVLLPAEPNKRPAPAIARAPTPLPGRCRRVLIVDDEVQILNVAKRVLVAAGFDVAIATRGEEALVSFGAARSAGTPFHVVVLDLTVPGGMGGLATLQALRALDANVRAVVSSGYSNSEVVADFRSHGFNAAISKPWSAAELRRVVAELAAEASSSQVLALPPKSAS